MKRFFMNEKAMMTIIIINTISLFIGGFWPGSAFFEWADCLFTVIFIIEAAVKLRHYGIRGYFSNGWNVFDFIILVLALPSLTYPFVETSFGSSALLAFRALRVLRAFKIFRIFRIIPNIKELFQGLVVALKSSLFVTVAFGVLLIAFSILTSSLFGRYAPQYFGDPIASVFSTFQLFTIEGWYELPNAVASSGGMVMGYFAKAYFSFLLFFVGIIGMSLANSIFVDAMAADNNEEVLKQIKDLEGKIDKLNQQLEQKNNDNNN